MWTGIVLKTEQNSTVFIRKRCSVDGVLYYMPLILLTFAQFLKPQNIYPFRARDPANHVCMISKESITLEWLRESTISQQQSHNNNGIPVVISNRINHTCHPSRPRICSRQRVLSNNITINTSDCPRSRVPRNPASTDANSHRNCKQITIAHLNAESVKNRIHFVEIQEMARNNNFDILSFSETWFDPSVSNAGVHLDGYKIFRLDRPRTKAKSKGGGVCAYVKTTLKAKVVKEFSGISESGVHQLWLLVQHRKLKSLLVLYCIQAPGHPNQFSQ